MYSMIRITALASGVVALGYSSFIYTRLRPSRTLRINSSTSIPDSLTNSITNKVIVNPKNHIHVDDSREVRLLLEKPLSDEQILARIVKGFFGGWIFAPECALLKLIKTDLVRIQSLEGSPITGEIWSQADISGDHLPNEGAMYFGAFRLVDRNVRNIDQALTNHDAADGGEESYIDFVFGADKSFLRGVHRFSVLRCHSRTTDEELKNHTQEVIVRFSHTGCNPKENKAMKPDILLRFHLAYAMLLFREGVAEVLKQ